MPVMPIGACIVAEAAERMGHKISFLDLMFADDALNPVGEALVIRPDVVGISARNIDNNDMNNPRMFFDEVKSLVQVIRKKSSAFVVLGGASISIMPEQILRYTGASVAVLGTGEFVFPQMLRTLEQKADFQKIEGIAWIENGLFRKNELTTSYERNNEPCYAPDFFRWINVKAYQKLYSLVPVQTKRGCPFKCIYCTYPIIEGDQYHLCKAEQVEKHLRKLASQGINDIEFVDNVFNAPYDHAMEICRLLAKAKLDLRLHTVEINPKFIDDNLLVAMEEAGFASIGITAESAVGSVLKNLGKDYTGDDVFRAAEIIGKHKLPCFWSFLIGGPGETPGTVNETLEFARNYIRPSDTAFFNVGIRIYPGTELENIARREGILKVSQEEMLAPTFYFSKGLQKEWLSTTLRHAIKENLNFIDSESFGLPHLKSIFHLAYRLGIRQPLWKHTRIIRRTLRILGALT